MFFAPTPSKKPPIFVIAFVVFGGAGAMYYFSRPKKEGYNALIYKISEDLQI